jgi:hypothetical protein
MSPPRLFLSLFSFCLIFCFVAAVPLAGSDLGVITRKDNSPGQIAREEHQLNANDSYADLREQYDPPDYCKCTTKHLQCLAGNKLGPNGVDAW